MTSDLLVFTLFYLLFTGCVLYPPNEFTSMGISISALFSAYLGSENDQFVLYHIKRSVVTLLLYSALPLGYVFILWLLDFGQEFLSLCDKSMLWQFFFATSVVLPLLALYQIKNWSRNDWELHPIVVNISKFCNNNSNWRSVASDINIEFRRIDKICIQSSAISTILATENWIMKVTPLTIFLAHQTDTDLVVNQSDTHHISVDNSGQVQYVNIEVKSNRNNVQPFIIRLNARDFRDLQDRVARPITISSNVTFYTTLIDKFVETFKAIVAENPKYTTTQELENCIGCMQTLANVKLQKNCEDANEEACVSCYCRPMWCLDCMARWFATRQDSDQPQTWLSAKCTCPMCRAKFCLLDVSLIQSN